MPADLQFHINVDVTDALGNLKIMRNDRERLARHLASNPIGLGLPRHLEPVIKSSIGGHELIEPICLGVLFAFDAACFKECLSRQYFQNFSEEVEVSPKALPTDN